MPISLTSHLIPKNGNFYILEDIYIKGGAQSVVDYDGLADIELENRKAGMLVTTLDNMNIYQYSATGSWIRVYSATDLSPISRGSTGSAGTALISSGADYALLGTPTTGIINFGSAAATINIGATGKTLNIQSSTVSVVSKITPRGPYTGPIIDDVNVAGGARTVVSETELDQIPTAHRKVGMLVTTQDTLQIYQYSTAGEWVVLGIGSGGGASVGGTGLISSGADYALLGTPTTGIIDFGSAAATINIGATGKTLNIQSSTVSLASQVVDVVGSVFPKSRPSLNLDFANSPSLDSNTVIVRNSIATYYDANTTVPAEENLLRGSEAFDNQAYWVGDGGGGVGDIVGGVIAPDGSYTAATITADTAAGYRLSQTVNMNVGTFTFSIYLASGNLANDYIRVTLDNMGYQITPTATEWTRYHITIPNLTSGYRDISINLAYSTDSINIWGAQLERSNVVTPYNKTTTAPIANYIQPMMTAQINTARFDYDSRPTFHGLCTIIGSAVTLPTTFADGSPPSTATGYYVGGSITISDTPYTIATYDGSTRVITVSSGTPQGTVFSLVNKKYKQCLGLLIEEDRINYARNSSLAALNTSSVTNYSLTGTVSLDCIIAPDGTRAGRKIMLTSGISYDSNDGSGLSINMPIYEPGYVYSWSIYAKAGEISLLMFRNNWFGSFPLFDLKRGICTGSAPGKITPVGNGWFRCEYSFLVTAGNNGVAFRPYIAGGTANGVDGLYMWGAQLEKHAYSSVIESGTTAAAVSRTTIQLDDFASDIPNFYNNMRIGLSNWSFAIAAYDSLSRTVTYNGSNLAYTPGAIGTPYIITPLVGTSFATSYIPTSLAATGHRLPDEVSITGSNFSSWYNQSQGSFYWRVKPKVHSMVVAETKNLSAWGARDVLWSSDTTGYARHGTSYNQTAISLHAYHSYAASIDYSGLTLFSVDGTHNPSQLSFTGTTPSHQVPDGLYFYDKNSGNTFNRPNCHISKIAYYPTALSQIELIGLTSCNG